MPPPSIGSLVDNGALELVSLIGQGGFASVYLARSTTTEEVYALKVLHNPRTKGVSKHDDTDEQGPHPQHMREAKFHSLCSSPSDPLSSITPLLKTIIHPTTTHLHTCLLLPYYPAGDLFTAILSDKVFLANPSLIKSTFMQILNGVDEAHSKGIFLRDLKPENCLLDGTGRVYLCDFGLATDEITSEEFRTGSVYHMSPECMGPHAYSPRYSDIWSLGILLLNLLTSRNPWREASLNDPTYAAYYQSHPYTQTFLTVDSPDPILPSLLPISKHLTDLLHQILHPVPSERLSLAEMKAIIEEMGTEMEEWYVPQVVFDWEGGCARCAWEVEGLAVTEVVQAQGNGSIKSAWSTGSDSAAESLKGSIILQRDEAYSTNHSTPSPLFETTHGSSLTGASAHIHTSTPSPSLSTDSSPEFCGLPESTPKRGGKIERKRSWIVYEDNPNIQGQPTSARSRPSPDIAARDSSASLDSLSAAFIESQIKPPTFTPPSHPHSHSRRLRPPNLETASTVHVDAHGIPKTPRDPLAPLGVDLNIDVRDGETGVDGASSGLGQSCEREGEILPIIEWVDHEADHQGIGGGQKRKKDKRRRSFFGATVLGRVLFGGGGTERN